MSSIENLWGMMHSYLARVGYDTFERFMHLALYFLRRCASDLDVRGRLDSRPDPAAEARIMRTRKLLESFQ